jgi:hypothetical protein
MIGLLQLVMLATGSFAVGIALLTAFAYPRLRRRLATLPPAQRATILCWICAAPLGGAAILAGLCLLPSLLSVVRPEFDHCLTHHGHLHLCLIHPPASLGGAIGWSVNGVFWGLVAIGILTVGRRVLSAARSLRDLRLVGRYDQAVGVHLIPSSLPFSAVVGLLRQKILLSTALVDALPAPLLRIVLAHEGAHVARHDSFWQLIVSFLSVAHLPRLRRQILGDLGLAAERACDEHAATVTSDRLGVAQAILLVERMLTNHAGLLPLAPGFGGSDVPARVEALLEPPPRGRAWVVPTVEVALIAALLALASSGTLHHWTETLLGLLVG